MSKISSFRSTENKHDVYKGKDCMKTFCKFLRKHTIKKKKFKKKKWKLLTKDQQVPSENVKICDICKEKIENKDLKDKKYCKVKYQGNIEGLCIAYLI